MRVEHEAVMAHAPAPSIMRTWRRWIRVYLSACRILDLQCPPQKKRVNVY